MRRATSAMATTGRAARRRRRRRRSALPTDATPRAGAASRAPTQRRARSVAAPALPRYDRRMLRNEKILLTGPTSQVGFPIARALAANNEVYGLARLSRAEDRERLVAIGVKPLALDLAKDPLDRVPDDFTYVLNFAVVKTGDFTYDLAANAEAAGRLIARCRRVKAFLHCSSGGVYQYAGHAPLREDAPLGDNHRTLFPTYSISKIAAETVVRFAAAEFGVPSVIARLSVPYGDN